MDVKLLPKMEDETERRYAFVASDRGTRWVFIAIKSKKKKKKAAAVRAFLNALHRAVPLNNKTLLTDNGRDIADRVFCRREKDLRVEHEFEAPFQALGIEPPAKPKPPQTNRMVERFNGRMAQVLKSRRFTSAHDMERTLHRFVWIYNEPLPHRALDINTPIQALKN